MTRRLLLAWAFLALWGAPLRAQMLWPISDRGTASGCQCDGWSPAATVAPCPPGSGASTQVIPHPYRTQFEPTPVPCGVPTRTALARLGLTRLWMASVPVLGDEQVLGISLSESLLFARTNKGYLHVFDMETGRPLWSVRLANSTSRFTPAAVNSFAVFVANMNRLFCLDRRTGVTIWEKELSTIPSCPAACDEERAMVGFTSGKLYGFGLKIRDPGTNTSRISDHAIDVWNWQTTAPIQTRPLAAGRFVAFGSDDGKIYVVMADEPIILYRIATGGPIGSGFGTHATRTLLAPSADRNLYAIDLMTAKVKWTYPSGAPITQEPLVAQDDIYIVNVAGLLSSLDSENGSERWAISTQGGPLITVGQKRIYLKSMDEDLFIVDRTTGRIIADPRTTFERVGLNLRCFEFNPTNRFNDRLFFANTAGLVVALRELRENERSEDGLLPPPPTLHRDPKAKPFGYIPPEGIELNPKRPAVDAGVPPAAAPAVETPPAPDKPAAGKPAEEKPAEEKPGDDK